MIRREPKATENQVTRFPPGRTSRSGKGCMRRSADMKLHCQSDRQTAACFTLVHLPGSYPPAPLRHFVALFPGGSVSLDSQSPMGSLRIQFPCHLKGTQGLALLALFPPISYKNCLFSKIPITSRNFFTFPENILYVENFRHKKRPESRSFSFSFITKTPDSSHADARQGSGVLFQ